MGINWGFFSEPLKAIGLTDRFADALVKPGGLENYSVNASSKWVEDTSNAVGFEAGARLGREGQRESQKNLNHPERGAGRAALVASLVYGGMSLASAEAQVGAMSAEELAAAQSLGEAGGYGFTSAEAGGAATQLGGVGGTTAGTTAVATAPTTAAGGSWIPGVSNQTALQMGGTIVGGAMQADSNRQASNAITDAGNSANALQRYMYDTTRADNAPWMTAGSAALSKLTNLMQNGGLSSKFAGKIDNEAGYQFARDEGLRANDRLAAKNGGFGAGSMKAGIRFAEDNANRFYGDAFNRDNVERTREFNQLSGIAGTGQVANAQVAGVGQNYANQAGQNMLNVGNAQGAAAINQGNIYGNMLNQGLAQYNRGNWWQQPNALNQQYGLPNYAIDPYGPPGD